MILKLFVIVLFRANLNVFYSLQRSLIEFFLNCVPISVGNFAEILVLFFAAKGMEGKQKEGLISDMAKYCNRDKVSLFGSFNF